MSSITPHRVWESPEKKKASTDADYCYHYPLGLSSKSLQPPSSDPGTSLFLKMSQPPAKKLWGPLSPFLENFSPLCDSLQLKPSSEAERREILTFEHSSATELTSYLGPRTNPSWLQTLRQWQSIFRTVELWGFMMNDLVSDMQILTIIATTPALEQKWFIGQEWEKLLKLYSILAGTTGSLWRHIYLGLYPGSATC